ncbi:hypothetical protein SOVF_113420, partial [Spinacia oleracea]
MRNPRRYYCVYSVLLIFLFAFFIFPSISRDINYLLNCRNHHDLQIQKILNGVKSGKDERDITRRILRGIGSYPPRCASKCGNCKPCKPVHVTVPPGAPVPAEYYPEAWKCKCGN